MLFEKSCSILLHNRIRNYPDELEKKKIQSQRFICKVLNFLRSFHRWENEKVQLRTNALFSRLFNGQLQFHVRKDSQKDPKIEEKKTNYDSYQNFIKF